jgi:hypothetical protein
MTGVGSQAICQAAESADKRGVFSGIGIGHRASLSIVDSVKSALFGMAAFRVFDFTGYRPDFQ